MHEHAGRHTLTEVCMPDRYKHCPNLSIIDTPGFIMKVGAGHAPNPSLCCMAGRDTRDSGGVHALAEASMRLHLLHKAAGAAYARSIGRSSCSSFSEPSAIGRRNQKPQSGGCAGKGWRAREHSRGHHGNGQGTVCSPAEVGSAASCSCLYPGFSAGCQEFGCLQCLHTSPASTARL